LGALSRVTVSPRGGDSSLTLFFPVARDCSCCRGHIYACSCCHGSTGVSLLSTKACSRCEHVFAPDPEDEGLPDEDGDDEGDDAVAGLYECDSPRSPYVTKLIDASASAIADNEDTLLSEPSPVAGSSISSSGGVAVQGSDDGSSSGQLGVAPPASEDDAASFDWSVRVFPPEDMAVSLVFFQQISVPAIVSKLGKDENGKRLGWPQRGWNSHDEFIAEVTTSISRPTCLQDGILVARAQTRKEANKLAEDLGAIKMKVAVVNQGNPRTVSSARMPPSRTYFTSFVDDSDMPPFDSAFTGAKSADDPCFHVILHLPADAPPDQTPERQAFLDEFFEDDQSDPSSVFSHIVWALGSIDKDMQKVAGTSGSSSTEVEAEAEAEARAESGALQWPHRGWKFRNHFKTFAEASLFHHPETLIATRQSYRSAFLVFKRLQTHGLTVSVISTNVDPPERTICCPRGHEMENTGDAESWADRLCDSCGRDALEHDRFLYECGDCEYDLCDVCSCSSSPCRIVFGPGAGSRRPYPTIAEGVAKARPYLDSEAGLVNSLRRDLLGDSPTAEEEGAFEAALHAAVGELT
jgi:hypothetical protein